MEEKNLIQLHREQAIATTFVFIGFILIAMVFFVIFGGESSQSFQAVREVHAAGSEIAASLAGL